MTYHGPHYGPTPEELAELQRQMRRDRPALVDPYDRPAPGLIGDPPVVPSRSSADPVANRLSDVLRASSPSRETSAKYARQAAAEQLAQLPPQRRAEIAKAARDLDEEITGVRPIVVYKSAKPKRRKRQAAYAPQAPPLVINHTGMPWARESYMDRPASNQYRRAILERWW